MQKKTSRILFIGLVASVLSCGDGPEGEVTSQSQALGGRGHDDASVDATITDGPDDDSVAPDTSRCPRGSNIILGTDGG